MWRSIHEFLWKEKDMKIMLYDRFERCADMKIAIFDNTIILLLLLKYYTYNYDYS